MGKLRNTVRSQFRKILDSSTFTADDFEINFGDPLDNESVVSIYFLHDKSLFLTLDKIGINSFSEAEFRVERSPGDILETETAYINNFNDIFQIVIFWVDEVQSELEAKLPIYSDLTQLRTLINEAINSSITDDEEFSVEEINNLKRKFDELEQRVTELEREQIITTKQKEEFSKGLEIVSENLEKIPKKTWLKTSVNKLTNTVATIAKSKEGRSLLADSARKLLGLD